MQLHAAYVSPRLVPLLAPGEFQLKAGGYQMRPVKTIDDIRHANFLELLRRERTIQAFADRIERSHSHVSQLKNRHVHSTGGKARNLGDELCRHIEARLQLPTGWMDQQHLSEGLSIRPEDQDVSLSRRDDAPVRIEWEHILKDPLKREFQTTMPDASMEPDIPRGAGIIFVIDLQPEPGDFVLIKDRDGAPFVRELRQVKPGRWEAHALNPAFLPMDSERDGLQVLAVFDGIRGRKARI